MKAKELEYLQVRDDILEELTPELFEKAIKIYKKKIGYNKFGWWGKFSFNEYRGDDFENIKDIQMGLLDKEVDEYFKSLKNNKRKPQLRKRSFKRKK